MSRIMIALFVALFVIGGAFVTTAPTVAFAAAMFGFCTAVVAGNVLLDRVERAGAAGRL